MIAVQTWSNLQFLRLHPPTWYLWQISFSCCFLVSPGSFHDFLAVFCFLVSVSTVSAFFSLDSYDGWRLRLLSAMPWSLASCDEKVRDGGGESESDLPPCTSQIFPSR